MNITPPLSSAVYLFLDDIREPEHAFEYTKQEKESPAIDTNNTLVDGIFLYFT